MNNEELILELLEHIAQITNYIDYAAISKRDGVLSNDDKEYLIKIANIVYSDQQEGLEQYFNANDEIVDNKLLEIIDKLVPLANIVSIRSKKIKPIEVRVYELEKELEELKNKINRLDSEASIHRPIGYNSCIHTV